MAKLLKLRRGTTSQHSSFTGAEGEVTIDTDKDVPVVHDGSTAGGHPVAAEDMANVSSASILGRISNGDIVGTKLENSGVTAAAYGSSSAIPIITVDAQGLVTAASTTAIDSTTISQGSASVAVSNNGPITSNANHDFSAGIDVTGIITSTGNVNTTGNVTITNEQPKVSFIDSGNNPDYQLTNIDGVLTVYDSTNTSDRLRVNSDGHVDVTGNLDVGAGVDVTGNITVSGTVDGVDIATRDTLFGGLTSSSGVIADDVTTNTQSAGNNTTRLATTAFVTTAIANADAFPSGTKMLFQQTSAPTGWTKVTSGVDNKALRVVSGTAGSGGSNAFSNTLADRSITANAGNTTAGGNVSVANSTAGGNISVANASTGGTVNNHTLTTSQMPSHSHSYNHHTTNSGERDGDNAVVRFVNANANSANTGNTGGGGSHNHGFTGGSHNHNANFSGSEHNHNATFSGSAHNHSISVTNLDLAVQYLDVIIASKD